MNIEHCNRIFVVHALLAASSLALAACAASPSDGASDADEGAVSGALSADVVDPLAPAKSYTIGGTIKGLDAGESVSLRLTFSNGHGGGTYGLVASKNGSFVFPKPVAAGLSYAVSVTQDPMAPAQLCTVAKGSGTAKANVTNVVVTCKAAYTLRGTVSGLTGTGLTLTDGAGHTLPIAANGAFEFPTPYASGEAYDVQVAATPRGPAESCTVANGTGVVAGANVSNVVVSCQPLTDPLTVTVQTDWLDPGLALENVTTGQTFPIQATGSVALGSLDAGETYTFSLTQGPSNQTCTLSQTQVTTAPNTGVSLAITCTSLSPLQVSVNWAGVPCSSIVFNDGGDEITITPNQPSATFAYGLVAGQAFRMSFSSDDPSQCICLDQAGNPVRNIGEIYDGTASGTSPVFVSVTCAEPIQ